MYCMTIVDICETGMSVLVDQNQNLCGAGPAVSSPEGGRLCVLHPLQPPLPPTAAIPS